MDIVDFSDRGELLAALSERDLQEDWSGHLARAQTDTESLLCERACAPTRVAPRFPLGDCATALIMALIAVLLVLASGWLSGHSWGWVMGTENARPALAVVCAAFATLAASVAAAAVIACGARLTRWLKARRQAALVSAPEPVLPRPVRYELSSALASDGYVLARVYRQAPDAPTRELVATVKLGAEGDSEELVGRFQSLMDELTLVRDRAQGVYEQMLLDNGLDEHSLPCARVRLAARLEQMRERRALNAGLAASLATHGASFNGASVPERAPRR